MAQQASIYMVWQNMSVEVSQYSCLEVLQHAAFHICGGIAVGAFSWQHYYSGEQQMVAMQQKELEPKNIWIIKNENMDFM